MKTSIATTLSIAGVIAAGVAAYAVNTSVLGASATADPVTIVSTSTPGTGTTPVAMPGATAPNAVVTARAGSVDGTATTYKVGNAGSVVIDTSNGAIEVIGILPAVGFTSEPARTDASGAVKVHFVSSTQRIEFLARMVNGAVVTKVTNEALQSSPPSTYDDDRDDDDRHDDDDDHYDDDDHDDRDDHDEEDDD